MRVEDGSVDVAFCRLEEKRKVRSEAYYQRKKALNKKLATAKRNVSTGTEELSKLGY